MMRVWFGVAFSFAGVLGGSSAGAANYLIGLDFLQTRTAYSDPYNIESLRPYTITDSANAFSYSGALAGWSEIAVRRSVTMAVEDLFRQVSPVDANTTLNVQIFDGRVPTGLSGRHLNLAVGAGAFLSGAYGYSGQNAAFDTSSYANDSYAGIVYLNNIDDLDVTYTQSSQVLNAIAGTAAHEIGHLFGLQHVAAGQIQPYPVMATGPTGLTDAQRLTTRQFETTLGTQGVSYSSVSLLEKNLGILGREDFDGNGMIDLDDASALLANWGRGDALFQDGDTNGDHWVNLDDASLLLNYWQSVQPTYANTLLAQLGSQGDSPEASVPEPAALGLLGLGGLFLARRRHGIQGLLRDARRDS